MGNQVDSVKNKLRKYNEILATYIVKKRMVNASKNICKSPSKRKVKACMKVNEK